jgi:hypothetical protein
MGINMIAFLPHWDGFIQEEETVFGCIKMYVCMYVYKGWAKIHPALALWPLRSIVLPLPVYHSVNLHFWWSIGPSLWAVMEVAWFQGKINTYDIIGKLPCFIVRRFLYECLCLSWVHLRNPSDSYGLWLSSLWPLSWQLPWICYKRFPVL